MSETASSLAITEKKPQRAGGCIGIFFQLFDWNRRFAKKKLFSKKLLPPVRSKQASKKFGGDDKQPKIRLIADENCGGFPNVKKNGISNGDSEQKHETRAPSLVARLMGLESMPAVQRGKSKEASSFASENERADKFVNRSTGFEKEELSLDKVEAKSDWRPQKLQKTGVSEGRPIAKFGGEALQFKNVMARSRKHYPSKLGSPVKSPRNLSGRHTSRLIGAATRILEPGLQRSRARCALTYHTPKPESLLEETTTLSPEEFYNSTCYPSVAATPPKVQSSCENCGHMLDISNSRCNVQKKQADFVSPVPHYVNPCSQGSERRTMPRQFIFYKEPGEEKWGESSSGSALLPGNAKPCPEPVAHKKSPKRESQVKWHSISQQCESQKSINSSAALKQKSQMPNQTLPRRDRTKKSKPSCLQGNRVSAAANAICEAKNSVAFNQSFSSHDRSRMPIKIDSCKFQTDRKTGIRRKDSMSSLQKNRPTNVCRDQERSGIVSSYSKNTCSDVISRKEASIGNFINRPRIESRLAPQGELSRSGSSGKKENNIVSFTFNSSVKHKTGNYIEDANSGKLNDFISASASQKSTADMEDLKTSSQKLLPLSGDALSALLEQKLRELTSQDEDELVKPKKTTTMILQELISALTAGQPSHEDLAVQSNSTNNSCHHPEMSNIDTSFTFKAKPKSKNTLVCHDHDEKERLSPGSVLEASFSNDSCLSSSFGDSSGNKLMHESIGCFHEELNTTELDSHILDSATSISTAEKSRRTVSHLLNNVSAVLCNISLPDTIPKDQLTHANEVLLNAELMLGGADNECSVGHFLLTELEMLARIIWMNFGCTHGWNELEGFAFASAIEYLDSRYNQLSKCGYAAWSRMPLHMDSTMLIEEIVEEIRRWKELAGMIPDDLIEWDMSHSLGKWTDFDIEAFEAGAEIDGHIIQLLIDEIVIDLREC